ncbi:MAG: hypothetical protein ACKPFA_24480, partial [Dolichospermum sp.]
TDGDTGYGTSYNVSGYGYYGLGSESGTVYDYNYWNSDSFSNYDEADLYQYQTELYYFTYTYGNGDSYSGYGYALAGTYSTGQFIGGYYNETGNYGYYSIDSVYNGYYGSEGQVSV